MSAEKPERRRRPIYTRPSSEEGFEQDFISLDAERDACEAHPHFADAETTGNRNMEGVGWSPVPSAKT
jgi:hypothetical protein